MTAFMRGCFGEGDVGEGPALLLQCEPSRVRIFASQVHTFGVVAASSSITLIHQPTERFAGEGMLYGRRLDPRQRLGTKNE